MSAVTTEGKSAGKLCHFLRNVLRCVVGIEYRTSWKTSPEREALDKKKMKAETVLTHSIPVSMNTYSFLFQSGRAYNPMVFEVETHMKADSSLSDGSSKNTFITTPVVRNSVTCENIGGEAELSPEGPSENVRRISTNSITLSSS